MITGKADKIKAITTMMTTTTMTTTTTGTIIMVTIGTISVPLMNHRTTQDPTNAIQTMTATEPDTAAPLAGAMVRVGAMKATTAGTMETTMTGMMTPGTTTTMTKMTTIQTTTTMTIMMSGARRTRSPITPTTALNPRMTETNGAIITKALTRASKTPMEPMSSLLI